MSVSVGGVRQREAEIVGNLPPVSRGTKRNTRFLYIYFDRCGSLAQLAYATILRDLRGVLEHLRAPVRCSRLSAPTDEDSVGPKHSGRQGKEGRAIGREAGLLGQGHSASDGTHQRERERRKDVMLDESLAVQIYLQWIYERCVW